MTKKQELELKKIKVRYLYILYLAIFIFGASIFTFHFKKRPVIYDRVNKITIEKTIVDSNITPFVLPFIYDGEINISSQQGLRPAVYKNGNIVVHGMYHDAIDIPLPKGTVIIAAKDGIITDIKKNDKNSGNFIEISHPDGTRTSYAHLSKIEVEKDQWVYQGERIGLSGNSGNSTGPHLHFSMRLDISKWLDIKEKK